jgi:hypothetical protein
MRTLNFTVHNREGLLAHIAENLTDLASWCGRRPTRTVNQPFAPHPTVVARPRTAVGRLRISWAK